LNLGARTLGLPERWAPAILGMIAKGGTLLLCPFF
jgi:hypothetical protein